MDKIAYIQLDNIENLCKEIFDKFNKSESDEEVQIIYEFLEEVFNTKEGDLYHLRKDEKVVKLINEFKSFLSDVVDKSNESSDIEIVNEDKYDQRSEIK